MKVFSVEMCSWWITPFVSVLWKQSTKVKFKVRLCLKMLHSTSPPLTRKIVYRNKKYGRRSCPERKKVRISISRVSYYLHLYWVSKGGSISTKDEIFESSNLSRNKYEKLRHLQMAKHDHNEKHWMVCYYNIINELAIYFS